MFPEPPAEDWVMVETPTKEENVEAEKAAAIQESAPQEADNAVETEHLDEAKTAEPESSEQSAKGSSEVVQDVKMQDSDSANTENAVAETPDGQTLSEDKNKDEFAKETKPEENTTDASNPDKSGSTEEKKTEDSAATDKTEEKKTEEKIAEALVEIEDEEGEDYDPVEIAEGHIALDGYTSDLHFISTKNGLCGHNLIKNGFSYLWAGARANKGAKGGKIGYEMKVIKKLEVDLPEKEGSKHAVRIGWSSENSSLQLGESSLSYGYESSGKVCASSSFFDYGEEFGEGDVIGTYLDLESEPKTLRYTKNGKDLDVAMSLTVKLEEKPLFPHVFLRNMQVELNFGANDEPWFETLDGYSLLQNAGAENIADKSSEPLLSKEECEVLLMVGLPNSGKSTWVQKYIDSHPEKHYNIIGVNQVLERCRLEGKRRKKTDEGHEALMKNVMTVLTKLYQLCPKKTRNFIYDQNNVYEVAQKTKMEAFTDFKRKAVLLVPTHDNLRRRTSDAKRKGDNIHDVPFGDLCDMKCEFHQPEVGDLFGEIIYPELDDKNASKTIRDYHSDGSRAKRTGRDEYYPKKRPRHDDRSYGRDYQGSRDYRRDGWRSSGSGYGGSYGGEYSSGGGYKSRSNYGSGGNKGGQSNYHPYRRSGGSGGGYRQNQSYGSGYGGSYGSGSYGSSGGYGSNYGSYGSGYGSGSYGSSGSGGYNYSNYQGSSNRGSSNTNTGHWGQGQYGGSGSYGSQSNPNQQWGGSNSGWGGYNYNNYSGGGSGYGGSSYSY